MDGDLDLETDAQTTSKKRRPRVGRRAKADIETEEASEAPETTSKTTAKKDDDEPPKPSKRGGWGEDSVTKSARRRGGDEDEELGQLGERLKPHTIENEEDDNDDIPVIPDLEDQQPEEEGDGTMAVAPSVAVNRVATYKELDSDLSKHAPFATLDNEIDLKLLMKGLCSESEVQEPDEPWEWDRLFTEVRSDLVTETNATVENEDVKIKEKDPSPRQSATGR